jgi:hypothetical protein
MPFAAAADVVVPEPVELLLDLHIGDDSASLDPVDERVVGAPIGRQLGALLG